MAKSYRLCKQCKRLSIPERLQGMGHNCESCSQLNVDIEEARKDMAVIDAQLKARHDLRYPDHSGNHGHFCYDWDGLYICEDCVEFNNGCQCSEE